MTQTKKAYSSYFEITRSCLALTQINEQALVSKKEPSVLGMLDELKSSAFKALASLGKTLCQWKEEIVRSGILESLMGLQKVFIER